MTMPINNLVPSQQNSIYYDPGFRRVLEAHMQWLRTHPKTSMMAINPHDAYKYEGDFFGLLSAYGVKKEHQWVVMRVNNIYRSGNVKEDLTSILVPDMGVVDHLRQMHQTRVKKTGAA